MVPAVKGLTDKEDMIIRGFYERVFYFQGRERIYIGILMFSKTYTVMSFSLYFLFIFPQVLQGLYFSSFVWCRYEHRARPEMLFI